MAESGNSTSQVASDSGQAEAGSSDDDPSSRPVSPGIVQPRCACRVVMSLTVCDTRPPLEGYVDRLVQQAAQLEHVVSGAITLAIVDDAAMISLHKRYKQLDTTTDVLTFDLRRNGAGPLGSLYGDIVICLDQAQRQAQARGHSIRDEVLLYGVHGLLHLLGYDDANPQAFARMHAREDAILTALGVGAVFDRPSDKDARQGDVP